MNKRTTMIAPPQFSRGVQSSASNEMMKRRKVSLMPPIGGAVISETASTASMLTMSMMPSKLENTYKLSPDEDKKFAVKRVADTMRVLLDLNLSEYEYDAKTCGKVTCDVSNKIKLAIKEMDFPRYKFVCNVMIGENKSQGLMVSSRSLCDNKTDSHATATFKNGDLFAVATAHGFYYE